MNIIMNNIFMNNLKKVIINNNKNKLNIKIIFIYNFNLNARTIATFFFFLFTKLRQILIRNGQIKNQIWPPPWLLYKRKRKKIK